MGEGGRFPRAKAMKLIWKIQDLFGKIGFFFLSITREQKEHYSRSKPKQYRIVVQDMSDI